MGNGTRFFYKLMLLFNGKIHKYGGWDFLNLYNKRKYEQGKYLVYEVFI